MAHPQNSATQQQAENFHVLPKDGARDETARKPQQPEAASGTIERDPEAGSVTGSTPEVTQPTRDTTTDRSQVS